MITMWQTGDKIAEFSQFQINFMAKFFQKKPNRFQECFWHMFHTRIKNDASIDSKAWDVATALTYAVIYKQKEMAELWTV